MARTTDKTLRFPDLPESHPHAERRAADFFGLQYLWQGRYDRIVSSLSESGACQATAKSWALNLSACILRLERMENRKGNRKNPPASGRRTSWRRRIPLSRPARLRRPSKPSAP
jgi:hypothetical protein